MSVKLLTERHLEILCLKGCCTCSSESTLVKMPHGKKSRHGSFVIRNLIDKKMFVSCCRYFKQGTLLHNYGDVLAILLRLRQLCCHPFLVAKAAELVKETLGMDSLSILANKLVCIEV